MLQERLPQGTAPSRWTIQCACRVIPVPWLLGSIDPLLMEFQRSPGGVGSCSGFLNEKRWLSLGTVLPPGAQKHLWDLCVWNQG